MAHTIKTGSQADSSVTISGSESLHAYGPPNRGTPFTRGIFLRQVAGASGTWRWINDELTPGVASPSSYSFAGY